MVQYHASNDSFTPASPLPQGMLQHCASAINATHVIVATEGVKNYMYTHMDGVMIMECSQFISPPTVILQSFTALADKISSSTYADPAACGIIRSSRGVELVIAGANGARQASRDTAIYSVENSQNTKKCND